MRDIEIIEYFIFVNDNKTKLGRFKTLEELLEGAKDYIDNIEEANKYIGIGGEFWIINPDGNKEFGSLDFINRNINEEKFAFCRDIEKLELQLSIKVREQLEHLIEIL